MTNVPEDRAMRESRKACAEACPMRCATSPIDEVAHIAHILETQGRFGLTRSFIQHGTMSVHAHVILRCTRQPRHGRATRATGDPHRSRFARPRCAPSRLLPLRLARPRPIASPTWVHAPIRRARPRGRGLRRPHPARAQHHLPSHVPAGSHPSHLPRSMAGVPGRQGLCAPRDHRGAATQALHRLQGGIAMMTGLSGIISELNSTGAPLSALFLSFIVFSFIGWLYESTICALANYGRFANSGFLLGPCCPIYGVGSLACWFLLRDIPNVAVQFAAAALVCSAIEYGVGAVLEQIDRSAILGLLQVPLQHQWQGLPIWRRAVRRGGGAHLPHRRARPAERIGTHAADHPGSGSLCMRSAPGHRHRFHAGQLAPALAKARAAQNRARRQSQRIPQRRFRLPARQGARRGAGFCSGDQGPKRRAQFMARRDVGWRLRGRARQGGDALVHSRGQAEPQAGCAPCTQHCPTRRDLHPRKTEDRPHPP